MFDVLGDPNRLAVIVATILYYMLGGLWFSQFVFGRVWDESIGFERRNDWKFGPVFYVGPFVGCLVTSIATAILVYAVEIQSFGDAVLLGLITGIGYAGAVSVTNAITPRNPRPLVHGMINGSYHLLGIVVVSAIIYSMK